ncbi:serine threonine kinase [Fusarium sporotrichioides]|uniref:Serine threonine kinase n=1 Tax=Fusarium sporotrichioides TaxID=5514 RepID=A0A395SLY4_FUSSP|nr:serine threonine kinase [Fusarium sporotrichioides]
MAQAGVIPSEPSQPLHTPPTALSGPHGFFRKLFGRQSGSGAPSKPVEQPKDIQHEDESTDTNKGGLISRMSRRVVPGLPRAQTFKRQISERRTNLSPVQPTPDERRAVSMDRRSTRARSSSAQPAINPRLSAPSFLAFPLDETPRFVPSISVDNVADIASQDSTAESLHRDDDVTLADECPVQDSLSTADTHSISASQYEALIHEELEKTWILNLSMHFRDRSRREKFFVTYRERDHLWRRVTISLDYRDAPPNSLEMDLIHTHFQREKSAKIYEAIRESLRDIQFYDTVTNLKLQTTDGRLHVHVVEDGNEIIQYPTVSQIKHLGCRRIRERDIVFESHMSGFVYKVNVNGHTLIKKEIPSPDTIDEFLYEINALNALRFSRNVIHFYGVVVDDDDQHVKGLLINYADQGALIDVIYEHCKDGDYGLPWTTREKWARQIVEGLSDIHESGFVQGDFTLSNIVIDGYGDAKIIDINRRGCPVGWEPPEATPLIESNQRITMYIGVKSDLYQLGMVLWALAAQEDEPEAQGRPLILGPEVNIPDWYRQMAEVCLSDDPRMRLQAAALLGMFPRPGESEGRGQLNPPESMVDEDYTLQQYLGDGYHPNNLPHISTIEPSSDWSYANQSRPDTSPVRYEPYRYTRGRSPPSPLPSNCNDYDSPRGSYDVATWAANQNIPSSYSDIGPDGTPVDETPVANRAGLIDSDALTAPDSTMGKRETPATSTTTPSPTRCADSVHGRALPTTDKAPLAKEKEQNMGNNKGKVEVPHRELATSATKPGNISPGDNDTVVRDRQQARSKDEMAKDDVKTHKNVIPTEKRAGLVESEEVKVARASRNPQKSLEDLPKNDDRAKEIQLPQDGKKTENHQTTSVDEKDVPDKKAEAKAEQTTAKRQGSTAPGAYQTTPGCTKKEELDAGKADRAPEREATNDHVKGFGFSKTTEDPCLLVHDKPSQKKHTNYDKPAGVKPPRGV